MANSTPAAKQPAQLTPEQMKAGVERLRKRLDALKRFEPTSVAEQYTTPAEVDRLSAAIDDALVRTFGADTPEYNRYRFARDFDTDTRVGGFYPVDQIGEMREALARSKASNIALLEQAIEWLEDQLFEIRVSQAPPVSPAPGTARPRKVFVVHGHEGELREAVARFLEQIEFISVILHEQANEGRTVIEKFEAHADVGFAVVLLTPDDLGGSRDGTQQPRARQNVILEWGYFIGRLGRSHVCALKKGDVELPSDILGIVWEPIDEHGAWKRKLAKELEDAGFQIDWRKVGRA